MEDLMHDMLEPTITEKQDSNLVKKVAKEFTSHRGDSGMKNNPIS